MIKRYSEPEQVDRAFIKLRGYWDGMLSKYRVESADGRLDRMVNIWNQYQCMVTFNMSRSASYFESGIGRGMGFRDSNQDILGFVHRRRKRRGQGLPILPPLSLKMEGLITSTSR